MTQLRGSIEEEESAAPSKLAAANSIPSQLHANARAPCICDNATIEGLNKGRSKDAPYPCIGRGGTCASNAAAVQGCFALQLPAP